MITSEIKNCDCTELMKKMIDGGIEVDLTVTSPPYDNMRSYTNTSDNWNFDKFKEVADLLYKVTAKGGVVVWVVGDSTVKGSETLTSFKQALYFKEIGFNVHDTMIYRKTNPIPQNHNRYEQCFEYMFVFSKGKPKTFNPIRIPTLNAGKEMNWGKRKTIMDDKQCRRHRNGDEVLTTKNEKMRFNIFEYSIGGGKTGHPAVFPLQLAVDHVISWSNEKDIVFDPFMGSGTTMVAALRNNRNFIGSEIVPQYFQICEKRLKETLEID